MFLVIELKKKLSIVFFLTTYIIVAFGEHAWLIRAMVGQIAFPLPLEILSPEDTIKFGNFKIILFI